MEAQVASQKPASRRRGYCLQDRNGRNINFDQNWGLVISQKLKAWKHYQSYHLFKWVERCVSAAKWLVMPVPASSLCFPESLNYTWTPFLILATYSGLAPLTACH